MKRILISGTFDPPTKGHLSIIKKCAGIFDEVIVCIFINAEKVPEFSCDIRMRMLESMCADIKGVRIDSYDGMVADYTRKNYISYVARGIRNEKDIEYELLMARYNNSLNDALQTIFFVCEDSIKNITSTLVRDKLKKNEDISGLVDKRVLDIINEKRRMGL